MDVILPFIIDPTPAFPASSTDLAASNPDWSSVTTYALADRVVSGYRVYQSLQASNLNHTPPTTLIFSDDPLSDAWWVYVKSDNRAAMFDTKGNTYSSKTTSFYSRFRSQGWYTNESGGAVFVFGKDITTIAVLNVDAVTVRLTVRDNAVAGTLLYDVTKGLSDVLISDWYEYFFSPTSTKISQLIFNDIPPNPTPLTNENYYELIVTGITGNTVSVGNVVLGSKQFLGHTQYGVNTGITNYSKKETDAYGNVKITKRSFSKKMQGKVAVDNADNNKVQALMYSLKDLPCVWIGSDDARFQESLIVYGFYKDFSTEISYPSYSMMNLDIEGLT